MQQVPRQSPLWTARRLSHSKFHKTEHHRLQRNKPGEAQGLPSARVHHRRQQAGVGAVRATKELGVRSRGHGPRGRAPAGGHHRVAGYQ